MLQRLECAEPPTIDFPDADVQPSEESYVPVNDDNSRIQAKSQGVLLPFRMVRQFPAAFCLGHPEVRFLWQLKCSDEDVAALDELALRVTHVGTSHAFATARFSMVPGGEGGRLHPSPNGQTYLRVPRAGRLMELDRLVDHGHGTVRRPPPQCEALVAYAESRITASGAAEAFHDWVALSFKGASWGADTSHTLARAFRRAVLSIAGDNAPALIHGHDPASPHLAWLPLPDVDHAHARGRIRGIAVALPLAASVEDRTLALAAFARIQTLKLPDGQTAQVAPVIEGPDTPRVLLGLTWRGPTQYWSSVTPVLLDRPPKKATPERLARAVADSIENAGYPRPISVETASASDFEGAPGALDVPTRVPRVHARIVFGCVIQGPVVAGRWRNFGVGLFRPTPQDLLP